MSVQSFFWRRHPDLNRGIKVLQTLALPLGYSAIRAAPIGIKKKNSADVGAGNEIRTRDIHLGKVTLYHWAIPAFLSALFFLLVEVIGFEPMTLCL